MENDKSESRRKFIKTSAVLGGVFLANPVLSEQSLVGKSANPMSESAIDSFFEACKNGDVQRVKDLLSQHPSFLNAKNKSWQSAYTVALLNDHKEIGDFLKTKGYLPDLHESALALDWDRYNELIGEDNENPGALVNQEHPMGGTAMWAAAAGGAGSSIWRVYAANGNPNLRSNQNAASTPLQKALEYPDLKTAELTAASMLSNDTDPNPDENENPPPLHIAAMRGSTEMIEMLLRLGANVNQLDVRGRTAVEIASYFGQEKAYELLVNHGRISRTCRTSRYAFTATGEEYSRPDMTKFSINAQGNLVGSAHGSLDVVKQAVSQNNEMAHSMATTSESAVEAGAHMGNKPIVDFLLEAGAPYSLPTAVFMNDFTNVKKMLNEDANRIHERGAHDFPLLWYPIISGGNVEMASLLIERGAKIEEQHFLGTTALHYSCFRGPIDGI
jgi:ankyrin repeat protein